MAHNKTFSYMKAFRFAVRTYIDNFSLFLSFFAVAFGFMCILVALNAGIRLGLHIPLGDPFMPALLGKSPELSTTSILFLILSILYSLFSMYYMYQVLHAGFALYNNKEVHWKDFFDATHFFRYLGAMLWLFIKIFAGLIVFILPGIYIGTKYLFTGYSLIDNRSHSIGEDATFAAHVSKDVLWRILGLLCIYVFIGGLIAILIHQLRSLLFTSVLLWTFTTQSISALFSPLIWLTSIHVYKQLLSSMSTEETPPTAQAEDGSSQV